jgi:PBP1b-binding outer membrane lipoprotein LpoB
MRVNKWGIGVLIAAAVVLTGCSAGGSDAPSESKPSGAASQEAEAPATDCPELTEGATVDGTALGACVAEAMSDSAGYAATTDIMGMQSTARVNPADDAIESISPMGSIIAIGDDVWVKTPSSEWQAADPASSDPIIAALSTSAADATSIDPAAAAESLTGEFTVTGTGERLGQKVFLVGGTVEQQGTAVEVVFEITADYVTLASTSSASVEGQSVEISMEITEWDAKQDIVAPV